MSNSKPFYLVLVIICVFNYICVNELLTNNCEDIVNLEFGGKSQSWSV